MQDRRHAMRMPTRHQLFAVIEGLSLAGGQQLESALSQLHHDDPVRWQAFMREAQVLIDTMAVAREQAFADTEVFVR